ncbi:MAG TPA: septum formation initiator family protein [Patescibacteria group bacterium]|nr:septum formation initiator family protein [Patescibacteria group bacterium]
MLTRIKSLLQVLSLFLAVLLAFSLIKSIVKITGSGSKITDEEVKVIALQKQNEILNSELQSVQTPQFIESQARDKLGLAKKGEIVVVLPDENSLKALAPKVEVKTYSLPDPVWRDWLKLFL